MKTWSQMWREVCRNPHYKAQCEKLNEFSRELRRLNRGVRAGLAFLRSEGLSVNRVERGEQKLSKAQLKGYRAAIRAALRPPSRN